MSKFLIPAREASPRVWREFVELGKKVDKLNEIRAALELDPAWAGVKGLSVSGGQGYTSTGVAKRAEFLLCPCHLLFYYYYFLNYLFHSFSFFHLNNAQPSKGESVLRWAAASDATLPLVELLLEHGADIDAREVLHFDYGYSMYFFLSLFFSLL